MTGTPSFTAQILCLTLAAACGGSNDRPMPDSRIDAPSPDPAIDASIDAPIDPPLTVHVAKDGNDSHDGITSPVETLHRAIAIAASNPRVTDIVMAAGQYTMRDGEAFPYTVPANVEIAGPAGGGVTLVGTGAETGLSFPGGGQLQEIDLRSFKVAIEASGDLRLKNLHVTDSDLGVHGSATAKLRITNLDITAPIAVRPACAIGISLTGAAELMATTLTTDSVGPAILADGPRSIDVAGATLKMNVSGCKRPMIDVTNPGAFALKDTAITGNGNTVTPSEDPGIKLIGDPNARIQAMLTNTRVIHTREGLAARLIGLQMTGGELSSNRVGFVGDSDAWSFRGVTISSNIDNGIEMAGFGVEAPGLARLTMRNCLVHANGSSGIELQVNAAADLGTVASPGNNDISANNFVGLLIAGPGAPSQITAVGNTWAANTQGADSQGHYLTTAVVQGPVLLDSFQNYAIAAGWSLLR
jgi:hypothetical protein